MRNFNQIELLQKINELRNATIPPLRGEERLLDIIRPLLEFEGYFVEFNHSPRDQGVDLIANRQNDKDNGFPEKIGIEYKHNNVPLGINSIQRIAGILLLSNFDHMILLSKSGFSKQALTIVNKDLPTKIELMDLDSLQSWISRIERSISKDCSKVIQAITELSQKLAYAIANDPQELNFLEWRDLERMLATIFEKCGFNVELTPPSKDGGRDIILEFTISGEKQKYLIEVKHWRSNKVGQRFIKKFVNVIAKEEGQGGLFLASNGYTNNAFEALTEIEKNNLFVGSKQKIFSLCTTYVKAESGLWAAPSILKNIIIQDTLPL